MDTPAFTIAVLLDKIARRDFDDYADVVRWLDFELKGDLAQTPDQQMLLGTGLKDTTATPPRPDNQFEGIFFVDGARSRTSTRMPLTPSASPWRRSKRSATPSPRSRSTPPATIAPHTVWNTPVVTPQVPRGLSVVGEFWTIGLRECNVAEARIVGSNEDDFKRNQFLARAELRAAFGVTVLIAHTAVKLNVTIKLPGQVSRPLRGPGHDGTTTTDFRGVGRPHPRPLPVEISHAAQGVFALGSAWVW